MKEDKDQGRKEERKEEGDIPSSFDVSCFLIPIIDIIPRSICEFTKPFPIPIISIHSFHRFVPPLLSFFEVSFEFKKIRKTGQEGSRRDVQISER